MNASVPLVGEAGGERGFVIAERISGERALPVAGRLVLLSQERLCRHLLVCGATGAGKTETLMRLAWTVAKGSDAPVFYLDGKGDRENAERFSGLMAGAGRETQVFPNEPFDGWRGEAHEIQGRLMEIIDYSTEGPAAWYRDVAKTTLRLVCEHPEGPPRSSAHVLARMDHALLTIAHPGSSAVAALTAAQVGQVRLRYEAFFGQVRGQLDGAWSWEDTSAGYVLLDSLTLSEEVGGLARFLFEDFAHYFSTRKPKHQFCVLIVDEFSSLAQSADMAARVEKARGFNTSLILAPQVVEGMGGQEETARILGSVETVIAHRVNTPDEIVALAGTRKVPELTTRLAEDGLTRERSVRMEQQLAIDPNKVRALDPGMAYLISHGRAMKVQIPRAPALRIPLPDTGDPAEQNALQSVPFVGGWSERGVVDLPF
ncbi:MAG TPA: helicase HerA-like domain-containing protein [Solirubrobacteraceae bacterium]|nr:helicase HerA-like domain-containing protein [Solirubrobacteraceae bacterium]